jgi:O-antigen/teichoic acid export membrane protein
MKMYGIKSNFLFNVFGTILPLIVAFVTIPIYISYIGTARYGVLSIIWILLGYFGFLDLGLSRASANALAKLEHSSRADRSKVLITALSINFCLGIIGAAILYVAGGYLLEHLLIMPSELEPEIRMAWPWIASLLPFALMSGVATGALEARERFLLANMMGAFGSIAGQILPVICAIFIAPSLAVLIPACVISRALPALLILSVVIYEEWPVTLQCLNWRGVTALLSYGGWIGLTNIFGTLLVSLDQLVIGSVIGVASVTFYAVPMGLVTRSQIFAAALSRTLFPRMSRFTHEAAKELTQAAMLTLAYGYGAICAPAIVLVRPFIGFWMGPDFAMVAAPVAEILFVGAWLNGVAFIPFAYLQAQGRPDIVAKYLSLELLPFALVLWFLTSEFGILGSAYAWVLRTPVHLIFFLVVIRFPKVPALFLVLPFALIIAAYAYVQLFCPGFTDAIVGATAVGSLAVGFELVFDPRARAFVLSLLFRGRKQRAV